MKKILISAMITGLVSAPAFAGGDKQEQQHSPEKQQQQSAEKSSDKALEKQEQQSADKQKQASASQQQQRESIQGEILQVKDVKVKNADKTVKVIMLETQQGNRVIADLGHSDKLQNIKLKEGEQVSLKGEVVQIGDRNVFAATSIQQGDKMAQSERTPEQSGQAMAE